MCSIECVNVIYSRLISMPCCILAQAVSKSTMDWKVERQDFTEGNPKLLACGTFIWRVERKHSFLSVVNHDAKLTVVVVTGLGMYSMCSHLLEEECPSVAVVHFMSALCPSLALSQTGPRPLYSEELAPRQPVLNRRNFLLRVVFGKARVLSFSSAYSIAWSTTTDSVGDCRFLVG
jgi:hypothetical protein